MHIFLDAVHLLLLLRGLVLLGFFFEGDLVHHRDLVRFNQPIAVSVWVEPLLLLKGRIDAPLGHRSITDRNSKVLSQLLVVQSWVLPLDQSPDWTRPLELPWLKDGLGLLSVLLLGRDDASDIFFELLVVQVLFDHDVCLLQGYDFLVLIVLVELSRFLHFVKQEVELVLLFLERDLQDSLGLLALLGALALLFLEFHLVARLVHLSSRRSLLWRLDFLR